MAGKDKRSRRVPQDDLAVWFNKALAGVPGAADEVFRQCEHYLLRVIRRALHGRLRPVFDAEDFVDETFQTALMADFSARELDSPQAVLRYLERTALNKVRDELRKHLQNPRFRHDRDVSLETLPGASSAIALKIAPDEQMLMAELLEIRMTAWAKSLCPDGPRIWALLLAGYDRPQIALELQISARKVQRVCAALKSRLDEESRGWRKDEGS